MYPYTAKNLSRCAGALLVLLLGVGLLAQTARQAAPRAEQEQLAMAPRDGRTVVVEGDRGRLSPATVSKVEAAFNRLTSRDLRSYQLGEILSAAETAAKQGTAGEGAAGGPQAIKIKSITISCCPLKIVIVIEL